MPGQRRAFLFAPCYKRTLFAGRKKMLEHLPSRSGQLCIGLKLEDQLVTLNVHMDHASMLSQLAE